MKIAIMGTGGLGGYFGGRLAHAGLDVTFIARGQHLQAIRANGLPVKSPNGDFLIKPAQATDHPTDVGPVDLILFCTKAYDLESAAQQMKPLVGAHTAIIPVLNGIDHIEKLNAIVGEKHVLGGLAAISAHKLSAGVIEHVGTLHRLEFGEIEGGLSPRVEAIRQTFAAGGFEAVAVPNIAERMWRKLVLISGMGMCSVVRGPVGVVRRSPETFALVCRAMAETIAVARAKGVAFGDALLSEVTDYARALPSEERPSMLVDLEHGRRLEVESLNGTVSRYGKELGVSTPVNDFIYACLKPYVNGTTDR